MNGQTDSSIREALSWLNGLENCASDTREAPARIALAYGVVALASAVRELARKGNQSAKQK